MRTRGDKQGSFHLCSLLAHFPLRAEFTVLSLYVEVPISSPWCSRQCLNIFEERWGFPGNAGKFRYRLLLFEGRYLE